MHVPERRPLLDTLTAIRLGTRVDQPPARPWRRTGSTTCTTAPNWPASTRRTCWRRPWRVAAACRFSLDELRYEYPDELVPPGDDGGGPSAPPDPGGRRPALAGRGPAAGAGPDRARAGPDRGTGLRALFPHGPRHRRLRPLPRHPLPGPGLRRQLGGLLLSRHHGGGPGADGDALRALHLSGARRAAGHRRGLRAPAPRGGHPVHL